MAAAFFVAACFLASAFAPAWGAVETPAREKFAAGNAAYERGAYLEAITLYEELQHAGARSAALEYNLGNALFKAGRLGPAILAYERASRLDPKDADAVANLEYLRTLTIDRIPEAASPLTALGITYVMDLTSRDQDAAILVALWLLAGAALVVAQVASRDAARRIALYAALVFAVPAVLAGGDLALKSYLDATRVHAVVMEREVNVLSGAGDENPTLFTVHEGLKVRVRGANGEWTQVLLDNGLAGWMRADALREI
ncbi:MAG: hypothetical protein HY049_02500 [Acidobacteria bacterium]|nr:hypothetical protein [Acidobacteriota bacterium]